MKVEGRKERSDGGRSRGLSGPKRSLQGHPERVDTFMAPTELCVLTIETLCSHSFYVSPSPPPREVSDRSVDLTPVPIAKRSYRSIILSLASGALTLILHRVNLP